jgi:VIT1/CCC1 family predicted Fe2+/Mn2+ transporter
MPQTPHVERHFTAGEFVRDIVIGMSDGLTVPFALAAGLAGAVPQTKVIVIAGLAEIAAGSIAMGLGGYLAAKGDAEHYEHEKAREYREVKELPDVEAHEVREILQNYGLKPEEAEPIVTALANRPDEYVEFMMRFELGLEKPEPGRAFRSAGTIAASYVAGGFIPLSPYILMDRPRFAFLVSVVATLVALGIFGFIKGRVTGMRAVRSASQTIVIGGLAAAAAYVLAHLIS